MPHFSKITSHCLIAAAFVAFVPAAAAQQQQPAQPADADVPEEVFSEGVNSHIYVIGAIKDRDGGASTMAEDASVPELPVVYEDDAETAKVTTPAGAAPPASPAR